MAQHPNLTAVHVIHNYTYADSTARGAASGFTSADVGKVAKQTDNSSFWVLTATTPTWQELTAITNPATNMFTFVCGDSAAFTGTSAGTTVQCNNSTVGIVIPFAAQIIGISAALSSSLTAGTMSARYKLNNVSDTAVSHTAQIATAGVLSAFSSFSTAITITPGDTINLEYVTNAFTPTAADYQFALWMKRI